MPGEENDPAQFQAADNLGPLYKDGLNGKGKTIILVDSFGSPTIRRDLKTFDKGDRRPAAPPEPAGPAHAAGQRLE